MGFMTLLIIGIGGAYALIHLLGYVPIRSTFLHANYSPRLLVCKLLAPFDATMTFLLIAGAWIGITTSVLGIHMMVYNVLTSIGLSAGVVVIKKIMVPRWKKEYQREVAK